MPTRRSPLVALATAACVLAVLVAQQIIIGVAAVVATPLFGQTLSLAGILCTPPAWYDIVFPVGVFFALWLISPVLADFTLTRVMVRGLAVSALAAVLVFVVAMLISTYSAFVGPLGGMTGFDGRSAASGLGDALLAAAGFFAEGTPLVILAVISLWIWLRRRATTTDV